MPDGMRHLEQARKMRTPHVVSQLRERELATSKWSPEQLVELYWHLVRAETLTQTASDLQKTTDEVVDEIARFGSWIRQGRKYIGLNVVYSSSVAPGAANALQSRLFPVTGITPAGTNRVRKEDVEARLERQLKRDVTRRYLRDAEGQIKYGRTGIPLTGTKNTAKAVRSVADAELLDKNQKRAVVMAGGIVDLGETDILVDASFAPSELRGRDVTGALGAILAAQPDKETVVRYLQRTSEREKVLTFEHVSLVWLFARLDRLDEIGEVNGSSAALANCFADGYDLLEVTRSDAMQALGELLSDGVTLDVVQSAIVRIRPLLETHADRLESAVRVATQPGGERYLERELAWLRRQVETNPRALVCSDISEMRAGQVLRTAQVAGLHTTGSTRVEETEIRSRLQMMGLAQDADQLVPTGVAAVRRGLDEEFWQAVERRADGDPKWDRTLVAAMRQKA